jgi:hypothetical protein
MFLWYCRKVSGGRASAIEHVHQVSAQHVNWLRWLNIDYTTRPELDSVPPIYWKTKCGCAFVESEVAVKLRWFYGSNTSMHASSQHVEWTALAEFHFYHPSSTRFRPSYIWINEISWYYCGKVSCGRASAIKHVQQAFAQHVVPTALAQFRLYHPSNTRFRPSFI